MVTVLSVPHRCPSCATKIGFYYGTMVVPAEGLPTCPNCSTQLERCQPATVSEANGQVSFVSEVVVP